MRRTPDALREGPFDLLVLGGGITGAGAALDAVLRGLRVALIDRGDFGGGTSSVSTKLVHGGLRYLERGDFGLVYEALHERRRLLRNAPHLVWPLPFVVPLYRGARVPGWKMRLGLLLYDLLAGRGNLRRSRPCPLPRLTAAFPGLARAGLAGGIAYADAQMDDARLGLEVVATAAHEGAVVANYVEAVAFEPGGVRAVDRLGGREMRIAARVVLNAAGPWADAVRLLAGDESGPLLSLTQGVHLVAPAHQGSSNTAIRGLPAALLLLHPRDGRVFFVLPWLGKTLLGTTDTDLAGPPDAATVRDADIEYLLEGHNHHLRPGLSRSDLLGAFVGVRPLLASRPGEPSARSREFRLVTSPGGLLTVVGGKYTTYRSMAEQAVDEVMRRLGRARPCRTRDYPLLGAPRGDWDTFRTEETAVLRRDYGLGEAAAGHLVGRYGRRAQRVARYVRQDPALGQPVVAGEPDLRAELSYQRDEEMAVRPEDFLLRRTRLGLFHPGLAAP
jgi:glycerol-3-phosphate dehydrogenase